LSSHRHVGDLLTVREVARRVNATERAVRRDIAAGVLPVVRPHPRAIRIRTTDLQSYARFQRANAELATVQEVMKMVGVCERTVRNWIRQRWLQPVNFGSKPLYFRRADVRRQLFKRLPVVGLL
jgi:excisionase family DNA binding protein